jgi:hypothetical protein
MHFRILLPPFVCAFAFATVAAAQEPAGPDAGPSPSDAAAKPAENAAVAAGPVREAKPHVYFVKDKHGELVPLVGFSLEDFERMLTAQSDASATKPKPAYRLSRIEAVGTTDARNALIELTFTIETDRPDWVRVPLGLRGSVPEKQAEYQGPGEFTLQFDAETDEYAVWIRGKPGEKHSLKLQTVTTLTTEGTRKVLQLQLPRAWTSSLSLQVLEKNVTAEVSPGAVVERISSAGTGSRIEASGLGGDFTLRWSQADAAARRAPALLEAQADILATIDGHSVTYDAQLAVTSFGGEFEQFRIRLPASSVLLAEESAEFVLQKLPAAKGAASESYEVRRVAGPTKSMIVRVQAVRPLEASQGQAAFDLGGVEVTDAVRQWGHLGVRVVGDWQVLWGERSQIRQIEAAPEFFRVHEMTAVFEYYGRAFTLGTRLAPRETRVTIEPSYAVNVASRRVYLECKLRYRVGGAKVFTLEADFLDWQIDEVGPPELIDVEKIVVGKPGLLSMPLLEPSTGEFEITIRAHRDLPEGGRSLELWVPRPAAGVVGPATWTVRAAENVILSPRDASHTGLLRQTPGIARRATGESVAWVYSTFAPDAKFAADYRVVSRTVRIVSSAQVRLGAAGGVVQTLSYVVAREPIDSLEFDVSARLAEGEVLQIRNEQDVLPWVVIDEGSEQEHRPARIRINLPESRLGSFALTANYSLALDRPTSPASTVASVPLLVPLDGELTDNQLHLLPEAEVVVQHVDEAWTPVEDAASATAQASFRSAAPRSEALVGVRWEASVRSRQVHIERSWIQSVYLGGTRWERAVFRVTTESPSATVGLPPQTSAVAVFVDGRRVETVERANSAAIVDLPADGALHVIDVRYQAAGADPEESPAAATLVGAVSQGRTYRQIVLPAESVLWRVSSGYTTENDWARRGALWLRTPRMSQADLERWCGASAEPPLPEGANVYLFSGFGAAPPFAATTIRRSVLVLGASAAVLIAAFAFLYVPALRRPGVLVLVAVIVGGLGFAYPEIVPAALQASAVGAVLAFAAVLLERNFTRRQGRAVRSHLESASVAPRGSTRTRLVPQSSPSGPAVKAADLPAPSSAVGGAT